jgi:hypothetical protein
VTPMPDSPEPLDDDEMLDLVRSAMAEATVPDAVLTAARAAFELRTLDAELAALIYDSRTDEHLLAGTRAAEAPRVLVFRTGEATLEVEFADGRLLGQIDPAAGGTVSLVSPQGRLEAEVDDSGCFSIAGDFTGMIRVCLHNGGEPKLVTEWAWL